MAQAPKKAPAKKSADKDSAAKAAAPKSTASAKKAAPSASADEEQKTEVKPTTKTAPAPEARRASSTVALRKPVVNADIKLTKFQKKQRERLLALKDSLLDSMNGVAKGNLRARAEGSEASAFGMHQADAGSDAYDRDFALSLLSQEQDSLYEIDEALKRVDNGTYGVCEISNKPIPQARLEALPFTRYTVECQAELEKRNRYQRLRPHSGSIFGLSDDEGSDGDDDDSVDKD